MMTWLDRVAIGFIILFLFFLIIFVESEESKIERLCTKTAQVVVIKSTSAHVYDCTGVNLDD